jgi:predicted nucleic acid-binding protein
MYLIHSDIILESLKYPMNPLLNAWLDDVPAHQLFVSVLSIGEIFKIIQSLPSFHQMKCREWMEKDFMAWFEGRIINIDLNVCLKWVEFSDYTPIPIGLDEEEMSDQIINRWGLNASDHMHETPRINIMPKALPTLTTLIAATALSNSLKLVTTEAEFLNIPELEIINPLETFKSFDHTDLMHNFLKTGT